MLNKQRHLLMLRQILRELFSDNELSAQLVFKGGTALVQFYDLDRFSTDLDFDLRSYIKEIDIKRLESLLARYLTVKDSATKANTYLIEGSYEAANQQIKVEVSRRAYPQEFVLHDFLGLSIPVLAPEYQLAHKLCAITSRRVLQNRDLYDADFMLRKNWQPEAKVIEMRTGHSVSEYYKVLLTVLNDSSVGKNILLGLGEVLEPEKRLWAQQNLVVSLHQQLELRLL